MVTALPQPQFSMPFLNLGDQTAWFEGLVATISRTIQDDEKNAVVEVIDAKKAEMSAEDEKALIKVLKTWKAGELKMPEVFEELSKKNGRTEAEWKTWFITNFEKLNSKLDLTPNVDRAPEARTQTPVSRGERTSTSRTWTMVSGSKSSSRSSSAAALVNAHMYSRKKPRSVAEQSSSENRGPKFTSRDRPAADDPAPRSSHANHRNGTCTTTPNRTRVRSRAGELPAPVTSEDLRAMARHMFENGDTHDIRRYHAARWRGFADRPENRKRTMDAWACIPRIHPKHAAVIERYLRQYQEEAESAKFTPVEASSQGIELSFAETSCE